MTAPFRSSPHPLPSSAALPKATLRQAPAIDNVNLRSDAPRGSPVGAPGGAPDRCACAYGRAVENTLSTAPTIGAAGFEPATTRTPSVCATRLRHAPERRARRGLEGYHAPPGGANHLAARQELDAE